MENMRSLTLPSSSFRTFGLPAEALFRDGLSVSDVFCGALASLLLVFLKLDIGRIIFALIIL